MTLTPDPHGQAAPMPCASIACLLPERGLIGAAQVVDAIESVVEVRQEIAGAGERVGVGMASITLPRAVAQSLSAARVHADTKA